MARSSRSGSGRKKLGNDPLAWMKQEAADAQPPPEPADQQEPVPPPPSAGEDRQPEPSPGTGHDDNDHAESEQAQSAEEGSPMATPSNTRKSNDQVTVSRDEWNTIYRFKLAMDTATTAFMKTGPDGRIEYLNEPMLAMLQQREAEIATENRGFRADTLEGEPLVDVLPQFRVYARQMERVREDALQEELSIGDVHFRVYVTGEDSEEGDFLGNTLEWFDVTDERRREEAERIAQADLDDVIAKIREGRLDERIDTDEMAEGFIKTLSDDINQVMAAVQAPMQEVVRLMQGVAEGNLDDKMEGEYKGDFGRLQDAVNESITNLRRVVAEIREATTSVGTAAGEISEGNQDLSQRTEEQASSLEETASSMEELTSTVKQNADNARESNQLATAAREHAEKGGELSAKVVTAMSDIKSSSREIADIITVIDEIAFQTNLLALNAAVEAARAGEHGRGFGVVAAEVRNLAQRSATSAKEIKALIKDSGEKVEEGTRLVDQSSETLEEIVKGVKTVTDKVAEIAAASEEQSSGIDEINKAVTQLDEVTQQNAALVEESAAAAESLDSQAQSLRELMAFFGGEAEAAPAAAPGPSPKRPAATSRPGAQARRPAPSASSRRQPAPAGNGVDDSEWEEF